MMRIVVISDTHSRQLPGQVLDDLAQADLIIHAGDICDEKMLKSIESIGSVKAVYGNMDNGALRKKLPMKLVLQCEEVRIGVVHGSGCSENILECVQQTFETDQVDAIVFGHSHEPFKQRIKNILYFNPGSPNDEVFSPYCSYGLLEISGSHITAKIVKVE